LAFTGLLMLFTNVSFFSVTRYGQSFEIHLGYEDANAVLRPTFGWSYWLCFAVGWYLSRKNQLFTARMWICEAQKLLNETKKRITSK